MNKPPDKPHRAKIHFVASSKSDLRKMPPAVMSAFGVALDIAQQGGKSPNAKPLTGFGGAGVLEVVEDYDSDTYRAVYTVRFPGKVYVLDAFQKKSKSGKATTQQDVERIKRRLKAAEVDYAQNP